MSNNESTARASGARPSALGLRAVKLLAGVADATLEELAHQYRLRSLTDGQRVVSREAQDNDVYLIVSGKVRITVFSAAGRQLTFRDMQAGDCLVFSALTVHGSGGNTAMTHRRAALSTRWLGDDAVWDPRPATAKYYYEPDGPGLNPGERVGGRFFPELWRRDA